MDVETIHKTSIAETQSDGFQPKSDIGSHRDTDNITRSSNSGDSDNTSE
jgi:hypothetical protein